MRLLTAIDYYFVVELKTILNLQLQITVRTRRQEKSVVGANAF